MAQFKIGNKEQSFAALAKCEEVVKEHLPQPESPDIGTDWKDWIVAHQLLHEANVLIKNSPLEDGNSKK